MKFIKDESSKDLSIASNKNILEEISIIMREHPLFDIDNGEELEKTYCTIILQ